MKKEKEKLRKRRRKCVCAYVSVTGKEPDRQSKGTNNELTLPADELECGISAGDRPFTLDSLSLPNDILFIL